jgi:hypothetical protein
MGEILLRLLLRGKMWWFNCNFKFTRVGHFRFLSSCSGGASIGPQNRPETGTLGAWLMQTNGEVLGISNNHVVAGCATINTGNKVIHPGSQDSRSPLEIATVTQVVPLLPLNRRDYESCTNKADVAWFAPINSSMVDHSIGSIGNPRGEVDIHRKLSQGETVDAWFIGRTSHEQRGLVTNLVPTFFMDYNKVRYYFEDQIECHFKVGRGDSGALVIAPIDKTIIGVLFSSDGVRTIANRWPLVKSLSKLTFTYN